MGQFIQSERGFHFLKFLQVLYVLLKQPVECNFVKSLAIAKCSDNFFNVCRFEPFYFAPHLEYMMTTQHNLEQFEITLQKIKFVVFDLLELVEFQISKAEVENSLHSITISQLKQAEDLIGLDILLNLPLNFLDVNFALQIIKYVQTRCQLFHSTNLKLSPIQEIHYFLEGGHLSEQSEYIEGLGYENYFLVAFQLIMDQLTVAQSGSDY